MGKRGTKQSLRRGATKYIQIIGRYINLSFFTPLLDHEIGASNSDFGMGPQPYEKRVASCKFWAGMLYNDIRSKNYNIKNNMTSN